MPEQRLPATPAERSILARLELNVQQAQKAAQLAQQMSTDAFTMFCQARQVPDGARLVSVDESCVTVDVPDPTKPEAVP